jgi:protein TonB
MSGFCFADREIKTRTEKLRLGSSLSPWIGAIVVVFFGTDFRVAVSVSSSAIAMEDTMFADSLVESAPHSGRYRGWTKLLSTLLQSLALAIAVAMPLFHVEQLHVMPPAPSVRMTNVRPATETRTQASQNLRSAATALPTPILQPNFIPSHVSRNDASSTAGPAVPGLACIGDCSSSVPIANIISSGAAIIPATPHARTRPPRISDSELGQLVRKVVPEYPLIAKQLGVQGAVVLSALIGKDGHVQNVQVVSGPPLLVQAARNAVQQWQYRPYLLNHEPIEVQTQITVNFVMNRN